MSNHIERIEAILEKVEQSNIPIGNAATRFTKKWYKMKLNAVSSLIGFDEEEDESLIQEWEKDLDKDLAAHSGKPEPIDPFAGMPDFIRETLEKL